jgi:pyrroloquinoline-quinone synthase
MLERDAFYKVLETNLHQRLKEDHPLINELFEKKDPDILRLMVRQGYQLTKVFAIYVGGLYYRCPLAKYRKKFAYNVFEEETGKMSKTDGHLELLHRFTEALGLSLEELNSVKVNPETQELIDFRFRLIEDPSQFHRACAAVMIASEGQNLEDRAGTMRREAVAKGFGIDIDDMIFFKVHAEEDVHHVEDGLNCTADVCTTAKMQEEAIQTIHDTCDLFSRHYDGIYRNYKQSKLVPVS